MRVMVLVKATKDSEAGAMPSTELVEAMGRFNEKLADAENPPQTPGRGTCRSLQIFFARPSLTSL